MFLDYPDIAHSQSFALWYLKAPAMNSCHKSSRLDRCQIASSARILQLQLHPSMLNNQRQFYGSS
jgi:hypothetical protein